MTSGERVLPPANEWSEPLTTLERLHLTLAMVESDARAGDVAGAREALGKAGQLLLAIPGNPAHDDAGGAAGGAGDFGPVALSTSCSITFTYRNWRGETSRRIAERLGVRFGSTEWHPEPQWLMGAVDVEKGESREFAMRDMGDVRVERA